MSKLPEIEVTEIEEHVITETPKGWDSVEGGAKHDWDNEADWFPCSECGQKGENIEEGGICDDCFDELEADEQINEDMDGDFDSAMTSAGFGTDEDYGYFGDEG